MRPALASKLPVRLLAGSVCALLTVAVAFAVAVGVVVKDAGAQDLLASKGAAALPVSWGGVEVSSARVHDDFELDVSGRLDRVRVGLYSFFPGAWTGAIDYQILADAAGQPGAVLATGTGQGVSTTAQILVETLADTTLCTGTEQSCGCDLPQTLVCSHFWDVSFDLQTPWQAGEGTRYWLALHAGPDFSDRRLFWVSTLPGDGVAVHCEPGGTGGPGTSCPTLSSLVHDALSFDLLGASASTADDSVRASFLHVTRATNISGHVTTLDHPAINDDASAIVLVTRNWSGGDPLGSGVYDPHPLGIYYISGQGRWALFNEDFAAMPEGVVFNVLVPQPGPRVQVVSAGSAGGSVAALPAAGSFGDPDAPWLVTQNWNPPGQPAVYNADPPALEYAGDTIATWSVVNANGTSITANASFNLYQVPAEHGFVHVADATNTSGNVTTLSDARLDGQPHAFVHAAALADPNTPALPGPLGVWWAGSSWTIYAEDLSAIPLGTRFAVYVPPVQSASFAQSVPAGDVIGNFALVDTPFTNDREDVLVLFSQSSSAPGASVLASSPLGSFVLDSSPGFAVFHQDLSAFSAGTGLNLFVPALDSGTFLHVARAATLSGATSALAHPRIDGRVGELLFVSQIWSPHDEIGVGVYNASPVGVGYSGGTWFAVNSDNLPMPEDAAFVVRVAGPGDTAFHHTTAAGNISGGTTWLSHAALDGDPSARPIVTHTLTEPDGSPGVSHAAPVDVFYDAGQAQWGIRRVVAGAMPAAVGFNVLVPGALGDADHDCLPDEVDLCPAWAAPNNVDDADGNGIGDACECGDQTGDGRVDLLDLFAVNDAILNPAQVTPLCDTNDDDECNLLDLFGVNDRIFGAPAWCSRNPAP